MYHWSTDAFPEELAYDVWSAELESSTIPWTTAKKQRPGFSAQYTGLSLGTQNIMSTRLASFSGSRRWREVRKSEGAYVSIQFMLSGRENVAYFDNREHLISGDAYIWDSEEEFSFEATEQLETVSLRLPRKDFFLQCDEGRIERRKVRFDNGLAAVLYRTVLAAFHEHNALSGSEKDLLEQTILPLATRTFGTSGNCNSTKGPSELFRRIVDYVEVNLGDQKLSVPGVAETMGISVRYLHALFAKNQITFSGYLRLRRVERAKKELLDPRNKSSITMIAYRNGFGESSHFSRVFKGVTGLSPREYRKLRAEN